MNLSLKIQRNLTFFQWPIRGPVLWIVYVIKVLDPVSSYSSLPPPPPPTFFPPKTSIYVQSWPIVFKKSEGLNYTVHYKHTRAHKMSGHLRIWPDKTYFWPDIVRWPAVNSSLARIIFCPIISISFPTQEFARRLWVCILSFWYICREYMHYIPYYLVRSSGLLGNILTTGLGGTCIHYF